MSAIFSQLSPAKALTPSETQTTMHELVDSQHCLVATCDKKLERPVLKSGPLLKWIDISASLASGRYLMASGVGPWSVTRSMDTIDFRGSAYLGDVLQLTSKIVSVGKTSMIVEVEVTACDNQTQKSQLVAIATVTMVRVGWGLTGFGPQRVPALASGTDQDRLKMDAAKARRSSRGRQEFSTEVWGEFLTDSTDVDREGVDPESTRTETVKFLFPEHMNPAGYTFGGQILSWMHDATYLCGSKFAKQRLLLSASVNKVNFRAPSKVTDVLVFSCQVNRVFKSSFVVGCRVEKVNQANLNAPVHICSAEFTLVASDPSKLRQVFPRSEEDQKRFYRASVRRANRIKRARPY